MSNVLAGNIEKIKYLFSVYSCVMPSEEYNL